MGTAHIKRALHQVGAIAVDGLSAEYVRALESLRTSAPNCLEGSLRVKLNDAVERFSHVQPNGEEAPKCVKADYDAIISTFDKVENEITGALANILGNSTLLVKEGSQIKELSELETKTHLHVYINNQVGDAPITNPFSLPFHQDNGIFLMLTPSDKLPVVLKDLQGRPVFTDRLGSDAVMCTGTNTFKVSSSQLLSSLSTTQNAWIMPGTANARVRRMLMRRSQPQPFTRRTAMGGHPC